MSTNAWLRAQRKGELVDLASELGVKDYESLKKSDLEARIESFVLSNETTFSNNPRLANFWTSRARATGSPIKRESGAGSATASVAGDVKTPTSTSVRRRNTRTVDDATDDAPSTPASILSAVRTPGSRALALASAHLTMPSAPAGVQKVVDRSVELLQGGVVAVQDSKLADVTVSTRSTLSTVHSILVSVAAFEAYFLRPAVLPDTLWFTVPAVNALHTPAVPIVLPNLKAVLTCAFWGPVLTWLSVTVFAPMLLAYFYNLSATSTSKRLRGKYTCDPLSFSIVKALLSYVVFAQGVTFNLMNPIAVDRVNAVVYGGWQGMMVGAGISGLAAFYDAILTK